MKLITKREENKTQERRVMQMKTIAHHPPTDAPPAPEQLTPASLPPALNAEHDVTGYGLSLWSVGVSCPSHVPSKLLVHPQPTHWRGHVRGRKGLDLE